MREPSMLGAGSIVAGSLIVAVLLTAWIGAAAAMAIPGVLSVIGLGAIGGTLLRDRRDNEKRAGEENAGPPASGE